jgi:hypothetical protein
MSSAVANYWINLILDHMCRTATWAKPAALWWGLFTTAPTYTGSGGVEVSTVGTGYGRVNLAPLNANYTATQGGVAGASSGTAALCTNAVAIQYGTPLLNWGNIVAAAAFDASTAGNMELIAALTTSIQVNAGGVAPAIPIGGLSIYLPVP